MRVLCGAADGDAKICDLVERESRWAGRCGDRDEVGAIDSFQTEAGPQILGCWSNFNVAHLKAIDVTEKETLRRRRRAEHAGVGVAVFFLRHDNLCVFSGASTLVLDVDIGEFDVLDGMARDSAEDA